MNEQYDHLNKNKYEGNGWSKYQLLVLQQLEDHNVILQNLNKEITNISTSFAVAAAEDEMWKNQTSTDIKALQSETDKILYDEDGLCKRVIQIQHYMNELDSWKTRFIAENKDSHSQVNNSLNGDGGLYRRLSNIERKVEIEDRYNSKIKTTWALYGSIGVFIINIIIQIVAIIYKK
jgi:hypothetical protein